MKRIKHFFSTLTLGSAIVYVFIASLLTNMTQSCQHPQTFVMKSDSGVIVFWPNKKFNPEFFLGTYTTRRAIVTDSETLKSSWGIDSAYTVMTSDTAKDQFGKPYLDSLKRPIPVWSPVADSLRKYVHFVPRPI